MKIFEITTPKLDVNNPVSFIRDMQKSLGIDDGTGGLSIENPSGRITDVKEPNKPSSEISSTDTASTPADPNAKARVEKDGSVIIGNEKRSGGTISWRTNNPGNVMYGNFAKSHGALGSAKAADTEPVAIMPTLDHGWKMQMALWRRPMYNNGTIDQGCRKWAGGVGAKKETSQYTIDLARAAGADIHTKVSDLSDAQLKNMVKKQSKWEGFKVGTVTTV
jgi:hypothetical protein